MEEKKLQNAIEEIKKITMTAVEKQHMLKNIQSAPIPIEQPIKSPWSNIYSSLLLFQKNHFVYVGTISCLVILLGGGVVFASQGSLPGNILYPLKVNIVEPIHAALILSPESKAQYQSSLATERLVEAETLASEGKLTRAKAQELNTLLVNNNIALNKSLDEVSQGKSSGAEGDIVTNFQAQMHAHARVLDIINESNGSSGGLKNDNSQISNTARDSANNIKNILPHSTDGQKYSETYNQKKEAVQSLIEKTNTDLNQNTSSNLSQVKQTVIDDTHKTLDQAQQLLNKADTEDQKGNSNDAYSSILNSESSAKEANILLKTGLNLDEEK